MSTATLEDVVDMVRVQAAGIVMLSSEEIAVPEPQDLTSLDSFSVVQLLLGLEDYYHVELLEELATFRGRTFEELAELVLAQLSTAG